MHTYTHTNINQPSRYSTILKPAKKTTMRQVYITSFTKTGAPAPPPPPPPPPSPEPAAASLPSPVSKRRRVTKEEEKKDGVVDQSGLCNKEGCLRKAMKRRKHRMCRRCAYGPQKPKPRCEPHGKIKSRCRQCNGTSICQNEGCERKARVGYKDGLCKTCFYGSSTCQNEGCERQAIVGRKDGLCPVCFYGKSTCKKEGCERQAKMGHKHGLCPGCVGYCEKRKCEHGNQTYHCTRYPCTEKDSLSRCMLCKTTSVNGRKGNEESQICAQCKPRRVYLRRHEEQMKAWLKEADIIYTYHNKKLPCAKTIRYPDFTFTPSAEHVVILEVDENEHRCYNSSCEIKRISELYDSVPNQNLHMIRFNPDEKGVSKREKKAKIMQALRTSFANNIAANSDAGCVVEYIGYSVRRVVKMEELFKQLQSPSEPA